MLSRRALLSAGISAGLTTSLAGGVARAADQAGAAPSPMRRRLRIAHLTDLHIQPELAAARGVAACLNHVQAPAEHPGGVADLIITGGDTIMDAMAADMARTQLQWKLWRTVKADHCGIEVQSVVGNHDVWGWTKAAAQTTGSEPLYGKQWACDEFGRDKPYKSFDRGGWHIVILDSTFPFEQSYIGRLDDAQWDWLDRDLVAVAPTTPVIIFSHIPILSATPIAVAEPPARQTSGLQIPGGRIHADADRFQKLFALHRTVKACVSGHMHLVEQLDFQGVRYLCNGAVSGGWWKGKNRDTDFGYALVDLFDDGSVERQYIPYGWTAAV